MLISNIVKAATKTKVNMIIIYTILSLFIWSCNNAQEVNVPEVQVTNTVIDVRKPTDEVDLTAIPEGQDPQKTQEPKEEPIIEELVEKVIVSEVKKELKISATKKEATIKKSKEKSDRELVVEIPKVLEEVKVEVEQEVVEVVEDKAEPRTDVVLEESDKVKESFAKPDHAKFDVLLNSFVDGTGNVNYKGFKASEAKLDAYLADLSSHTVEAEWSRNEKLAYWINVYNAYTIKLILKNYPLRSITDLHGGKPWDVKWIKIAGSTYSLNDVENVIIRPTFKEPRIHFAVNCAAESCPPLANKAYTADNLNSLLEKQAKSFIQNSKFNKISAKSITVSKIFEWYGSDFGNLIDYLNKYSSIKISPSAAVNYSEYNWKLNGK